MPSDSRLRQPPAGGPHPWQQLFATEAVGGVRLTRMQSGGVFGAPQKPELAAAPPRPFTPRGFRVPPAPRGPGSSGGNEEGDPARRRRKRRTERRALRCRRRGRPLPVGWRRRSCASPPGCWSQATCRPVGRRLLSNTGRCPRFTLLGRWEEHSRSLHWAVPGCRAAAGTPGTPGTPSPSLRLRAARYAGRRGPGDPRPVPAKPCGAATPASETHPAPWRLKANSYFKNKTTLGFAPFDTY